MFSSRRGLGTLLGLLIVTVVVAGWPSLSAGSHAVAHAGVAPGQPHVPAPELPETPSIVAAAHGTGDGVAFQLDGVVPDGATEAVLWYDTAAGHRGRRFVLH